MLLLSFLLLLADHGWTHYGKDAGGARFSQASQINRESVSKLTRAWEFHTGALVPGANKNNAFESTPILVDGTLYLTTPFNHIIALDPKTGAERWRFDAGVDPKARYSELTSRGVAAWTDAKVAPGSPCRLTIFEGT